MQNGLFENMGIETVQLPKEYIAEALDLIWDVFQEFVSPDYSAEGTATFKKFIDYNSIVQKVDTGEMKLWGGFINNNLVGAIATMRTNHISMLFVKKEYQGQGIAKNLFQKVVDSCKSENQSTITVNSSPYAVEAYHHLGFQEINTEQTLNGIRFTAMEYRIL